MVLTYLDVTDSPGKSGGDSDVVDVRFVDVVPGERIVQAVVFDSEDPAFAGTMTMTWSVAEVDGGTRVVIVAEDVPPGIAADDHAARAGHRPSSDQRQHARAASRRTLRTKVHHVAPASHAAAQRSQRYLEHRTTLRTGRRARVTPQSTARATS